MPFVVGPWCDSTTTRKKVHHSWNDAGGVGGASNDHESRAMGFHHVFSESVGQSTIHIDRMVNFRFIAERRRRL